MKKSFWENTAKILPTFIMCVSTIVTCFLSYFVWESEERANIINERASDISNKINIMNLELEKYRQTILLCDKINELYKSYNSPTNEDIVIFKIWEMGENFNPEDYQSMRQAHIKNIAQKWDASSKQQRIQELEQNTALTEIFYFFEDAMMLSRKGLLDNRYFDNYLANIISRLDETSTPSVDEFIEHLCYKANRNDIWEGYLFCRDSIMLEPIIIPKQDSPGDSLFVSEIRVKHGDTINAGYQILGLSSGHMDTTSINLTTQRDGIVEKILIKDGDHVRSGQIVIELRPR